MGSALVARKGTLRSLPLTVSFPAGRVDEYNSEYKPLLEKLKADKKANEMARAREQADQLAKDMGAEGKVSLLLAASTRSNRTLDLFSQWPASAPVSRKKAQAFFLQRT